jgi:hypothetical protein
MIFNEYQVRALLDGSMTQVRRPIKWRQTRATEIAERDDGSMWPWAKMRSTCDYWHPCPFGAVGDVFTSESHFHGSTHLTSSIPQCLMKYRISGIGPMVIRSGETGRARNLARVMPRAASRITLEITGIGRETSDGQ